MQIPSSGSPAVSDSGRQNPLPVAAHRQASRQVDDRLRAAPTQRRGVQDVDIARAPVGVVDDRQEPAFVIAVAVNRTDEERLARRSAGARAPGRDLSGTGRIAADRRASLGVQRSGRSAPPAGTPTWREPPPRPFPVSSRNGTPHPQGGVHPWVLDDRSSTCRRSTCSPEMRHVPRRPTFRRPRRAPVRMDRRPRPTCRRAGLLLARHTADVEHDRPVGASYAPSTCVTRQGSSRTHALWRPPIHDRRHYHHPGAPPRSSLLPRAPPERDRARGAGSVVSRDVGDSMNTTWSR